MTHFHPEPVSPTLRRLHHLNPWILAGLLLIAGARLAGGAEPGPLRRMATLDAPPAGAARLDLVGIAALLGASVPVITALMAGVERIIRAVKGLPPLSPAPDPAPVQPVPKS